LNFLEGTLPSEVGNVKALTVLDLRELIPSLMVTSSASIHFFVHFLVLHKQAARIAFGMMKQTSSRGRSPPKLVLLQN